MSAEISLAGAEVMSGIVAPVLTGFALASVVFMGTPGMRRTHPHVGAASVCFVVAAVALLFSMQVLAAERTAQSLGRSVTAFAASRAILTEVGMLLLFGGIGLFLWPRHWTSSSVIGAGASAVAIVVDLALSVGFAWSFSKNTSREEE